MHPPKRPSALREVLAALGHQAQSRPGVAAISDPRCTLNYEALAGHVAARAIDFANLPQSVGLLAPNSVEWVIADLALALAGKTLVPLPTFFSASQLQHIVSDAAVGHVLCAPQNQAAAEALGLPVTVLGDTFSSAPFPSDLSAADHAKRIIYTSGTTGAPKGVRLGSKQITASARGLLNACNATPSDHYLSVLPFSLLLEQIAAICLPLLAGAEVTLDPFAAGAAMQGDPKPLIAAFAVTRPTASVLVPGLLGAWVQGLTATRMLAPDTLRFIAVGGAPVPAPLAEAAWALGIPVHEGYGLSECCSVVSVNRPGARIPGTTGQILNGLTVAIEDGEIIVHGPTVMDGYLGGSNVSSHTWRTGDLGEFTPEGALRVLGRKDRLIVTPEGRNINPEWIETLVQGTPGVMDAKLTLVGGKELVLDITPAPHAQNTLEQTVWQALSTAPQYAQPARITINGVGS
jgi:long-subunit acyl-CoA synthetase (AMP-forming)